MGLNKPAVLLESYDLVRFPKQKVAKAYELSDVEWLPSTYEPFSLRKLEISMGLLKGSPLRAVEAYMVLLAADTALRLVPWGHAFLNFIRHRKCQG